MPAISMFFGIIIRMFYKEHNPPHFHVQYNDFRATIDISTLALREGRLPRRALAMVMEWAAEHRDELMRNWERAQRGKPLKKIEGLQ